MLYYLSYVEVNNTHAALMLSEQGVPGEPAKVIANVGFMPRIDFEVERVETFEKYMGYVADEDTASKVLYSGNVIRHCTFAISKSEKERFEVIIANDRKINPGTIPGDDETVVGGAEYEYLRHNCKRYALSVLKRLGVIEAEDLSNFFIQRPGTKESKLRVIHKHDMMCPVKDKFIADSKKTIKEDLLIKIREILDEIDENESNQTKESRDNEELYLAFKKLYLSLSDIRNDSIKLGINDFRQTYIDLFAAVDNLKFYLKRAKGEHGLDEERIQLFMHELAKLNRRKIGDEANKIGDLIAENKLEFFWRKTPKLTPRADIVTSTAGEKMKLCSGIKSAEIRDGLQEIFDDLNNLLDATPVADERFRYDILQIKKIVQHSMKEAARLNKAFYKRNGNVRGHDSIGAYNRHIYELNNVVIDLNRKLAAFEPQSEKTNIILRTIYLLVMYLKKNYVPHDATLVRHVVKRRTGEVFHKAQLHTAKMFHTKSPQHLLATSAHKRKHADVAHPGQLVSKKPK